MPICLPFLLISYREFPVSAGQTGEDQTVGPAIAAVMKLSYDEEYRAAVCTLGKCCHLCQVL